MGGGPSPKRVSRNGGSPIEGGPNGGGPKFSQCCTFKIVLKCWTFQIDFKSDLKYISNVDFDFLAA